MKKPWHKFGAGALLAILVFAAYYPSLHGGFVWDDDTHITNNSTLRTADGLRRIWFEPGATEQYYPLTHSVFWLIYHVCGLQPFGFHVTSVSLHAMCTILLWQVLMRLKVRWAWLGSAVFAVHPVCVESVAWMTELKNCLSGPFFLASILMALRFWLPELWDIENKSATQGANHGRWKYYWLALALYCLALFAKTSTVGLPAVIVLLLWWKRKKTGRQNLLILLPFFAVGVVMGVVTMWVEKHHVRIDPWDYSIWERCLLPARQLWFYLGKLAWPWPLMFMYPRWKLEASRWIGFATLAAAVIVFAILWRRRNSWGRPILFAAGYFVVILFPLLGFFNTFFFIYSFVNDHFQYLASMGPLAAFGAFMGTAFHKRIRLGQILACILLMTLLALTWRQTRVYKNIETLWEDTLAHNPDSWMAHNNYGLLFFNQKKFDESIAQFHQALEVKFNHAPAHFNLGNALGAEGRMDEAIEEFRTTLRLQPGMLFVEYQLAGALAQTGKLDEAAEHFQAVLKVDPNNLGSSGALGKIRLMQGKIDESASTFQQFIQLSPKKVEAMVNVGNEFSHANQWAEAAKYYRMAIQSEPNNAGIHFNLGLALFRQGARTEAKAEFQETLRLQPDFKAAKQALQGFDNMK